MSSDMEKVLIIEDEPEWQEEYKYLLSENNFLPMISPNYNDAKSLLDIQNRHQFVAAVLDLKLSEKDPGYGGVYLLEDLIWVKQIPVFVVSGYVDRRITSELLQVGVSYVWPKDRWDMDRRFFIDRLEDMIKSGPSRIQELKTLLSFEQFQKKLRQLHHKFLQQYTILMPVETRLRRQIVKAKENLQKLEECEKELTQPELQQAIARETNRLLRQIGDYQDALNEIFEMFPDLEQVIKVIDQHRIEENDLQRTWLQLESILIEVKDEVIDLKGIVEDLEQDINEGSLDISHKLKMTIPIIPFLLYYESEMGISLESNLKRLWESIKKWR